VHDVDAVKRVWEKLLRVVGEVVVAVGEQLHRLPALEAEASLRRLSQGDGEGVALSYSVSGNSGREIQALAAPSPPVATSRFRSSRASSSRAASRRPLPSANQLPLFSLRQLPHQLVEVEPQHG
jgi:hypothetical protein